MVSLLHNLHPTQHQEQAHKKATGRDHDGEKEIYVHSGAQSMDAGMLDTVVAHQGPTEAVLSLVHVLQSLMEVPQAVQSTCRVTA
jgi:hypothetical protein